MIKQKLVRNINRLHCDPRTFYAVRGSCPSPQWMLVMTVIFKPPSPDSLYFRFDTVKLKSPGATFSLLYTYKWWGTQSLGSETGKCVTLSIFWTELLSLLLYAFNATILERPPPVTWLSMVFHILLCPIKSISQIIKLWLIMTLTFTINLFC